MTAVALPEPLTPAGCDLQDFAFMPLDVARLRDSELAADGSPEECWAAVLLWCASWHQVPSASIPDNDQWIAKACGYVFKGKIDKSWNNVRAGAMRGWLKCIDGRLYHPVVAEKARDAWLAKLKQRWNTECGRIKKHNERHEGANVHKPSFEQWIAGGRLTGQPLYVPGDMPPVSPGSHQKNPSKRQGEGQGEGQGQGESKDSVPIGTGGEPPMVPAAGERWPNVDNLPPPSPPPPPAPPGKTAKEQSAADREKSELWAAIKTTLVEQHTSPTLKDAGVLAGKLNAKYGVDVFVTALRETVRLKPGNAHTYLVNLCELAAGKRVPLGKAAALSDEQLAAKNAEETAKAKALYRERYGAAANDPGVIDAEVKVVPDRPAIEGGAA